MFIINPLKSNYMATLNSTYLISDPPSYIKHGLDYKGNIDILKYRKKASVIGSREPTAEGAMGALLLTRFLVANGYITVSGLALGIDALVHKETLDNDGLTIAVLGTPIDRVYPKENVALFDRIAHEGLILSQFPIGSKTTRAHFPQRNRTMAYLSNKTFVCDATEKSGTKHQVMEALKLNRQVYILSHIIDVHKIQWAISAVQKGAVRLDVRDLGTIPL